LDWLCWLWPAWRWPGGAGAATVEAAGPVLGRRLECRQTRKTRRRGWVVVLGAEHRPDRRDPEPQAGALAPG